ncbi:MAG TPA: rhodanese-like domain-containing protein [Candidatus Saccharimonadales bacterium]|nr:rhodanese-like domain-containing protein [Candidatus Saccharimonadales bacterium]
MTILDVRTKQEYDQGHVDGALWFDVQKLIAGELPPVSKDEELVLYCRSGSRSQTAQGILESNGFTHVRNAGGIAAMATAGHRIVIT